jgi:hypothetical protein
MVRSRLFALLMTSIAVSWMLLVPGQTKVSAWACCQTCEMQEAGCYASCLNLHPDDEEALINCEQACDANLFQYCWAHCAYCSPDPEESCWGCEIHVWWVGADVHHQVDYCFEVPMYLCQSR